MKPSPLPAVSSRLPAPRSPLSALSLACSLLATTALAAPSVEERLAALEKQSAALAAENATLRKELGYSADGKAPLFVLPAGKVKKVALGGFIQANAEFGDAPDARWNGAPANDRFLLRRARLNLTATLANDFTAKIEADFGANSLNRATAGGNSGQLTDAYIQWSKYDFATVRAGQFKTAFGYEQLLADTKLLTIERALSSDRLTVSRQIGIAVAGDLAGKKLGYSLGAFNGNGVNTSLNDNDNFMWAGRVSSQAYQGTVAGQPVKLATGLNGFTSRDPAAHKSGYGADAQLTAGPATLAAEWLRNENEFAAEQTGWSLLAGWSFDAHWRGVLRYETFDTNTAAPATTTDVWTIGVDYLFKGDDLKLSLNYLLGDQPVPANDGGRLIARVQVVF